MADKPLFSIVVPAYNAEKTIGTCLDALLRLGGDDYEVVVVNDGSRDCTADIIRNRINDDARVRFVSQDNAGVYRARRAGCAEARGEYCLFVDADDKVEPDFLLPSAPFLHLGRTWWSSTHLSGAVFSATERGSSRSTWWPRGARQLPGI